MHRYFHFLQMITAIKNQYCKLSSIINNNSLSIILQIITQLLLSIITINHYHQLSTIIYHINYQLSLLSLQLIINYLVADPKL